MSKSYSVFDVVAMPKLASDSEINIPYQGALIDGVEAPHTVFKVQRVEKELNTYVFRIKFEHVEFRVGRAKSVEFTEYVATYTFPGYYAATEQYFLIKTTKEIAKAAIRQILENSSEVAGYTKQIDLNSIRHLIDSFHGAWFKVEENADVKSQAFFGPSVERDPRFDQALAEGAMQHVRFEYPFQGEQFHVGISSDCGILIVNDNLDEVLELKLVDDIKKTLLDTAKELSRPISTVK